MNTESRMVELVTDCHLQRHLKGKAHLDMPTEIRERLDQTLKNLRCTKTASESSEIVRWKVIAKALTNLPEEDLPSPCTLPGDAHLCAYS
jgi:hypothetical protein